jgi:hypothetical protein
MKKRLLVMIGVAVVVVVGGAVAWYLASPLLIDKTVEEPFPIEAPGQDDMAQVPEEDRQAAADSQGPDTASGMPDRSVDEEMPAGDQPLLVSQGQFYGADSLHRGSGKASIYQLPGGRHVLRFEEFSVTNGPDLHVLLAANPSPTGQSDLGEYVDLGELKGNLGNQNYEIPEGIDLAQFQSIVIYCQPFHVVFSVAAVSSATETAAREQDNLDHQALLDVVLYGQAGAEEVLAIINQIAASGDTRFVAALIDTLRYQPRLGRPLGEALTALTGEELSPDWFAWVEWAGRHPEIESFDSYPAWKAELYSHLDPDFGRFLYDSVKVAPGSRVEEIVWGGVLVDGIPALDTPRMVDPAEADYLVAEERVFGLSLGGDTRAYPARFLDWHEMFNDVVGGEPVSLAY